MWCYVLSMSHASHALKHPPVTPPQSPLQGPAGAPSPFPEIEVAIDRQRRRGRGAQSNASGRFEAEARVTFDDGWQSLEELPPFKTTVATDTARKVLARNDSPDIGFDRSLRSRSIAAHCRGDARVLPEAAHFPCIILGLELSDMAVLSSIRSGIPCRLGEEYVAFSRNSPLPLAVVIVCMDVIGVRWRPSSSPG